MLCRTLKPFGKFQLNLSLRIESRLVKKWFFHFSMTNGIVNVMKMETVQIDKAGRMVIPKPLRERFNLVPGDKLRLSVDGSGFRLEPTDPGGKLVKKGSVLVFTGGFTEPITTEKVNQLIEQDREGRVSARAGNQRSK
jgi:AbrB family looped-hinge helix DNA binding protein